MTHSLKNITLAAACSLTLTACAGAADRLSQVGEPPKMAEIKDPTTHPGYRPVSLPMPTTKSTYAHANSLWQTNRQTFFKDQRATNVGDILTVMIDIDDQAELTNTSTRSRASSEDLDIDNMLGMESFINKVVPGGAATPASLLAVDNNSSSSGDAKVDREEEVKLKLAAIVSQVLPNGNMVIRGRQEVRVNFEKRILEMAGVIRPEDIGVDNSIEYDKIAEARISYGGKGHMTDVQQPRYGQQIMDILMPF